MPRQHRRPPRAAILGRKVTSSATIAAVSGTAAAAADSAVNAPPTVILPAPTVVAVTETPTQRLDGRRSSAAAS